LADANLTGPDVQNAIQNFGHPNDFQAFLNENGKNIPKSPALFARFDRIDTGTVNGLTGRHVVMGDVNKDMAKGFLSSLTPRKIASDDFRLDNFSVAADNTPGSSPTGRDISIQWAKVLGEYVPHSIVDNFDPSDRLNFMGADKRAALLKVLARNKAAFTSTVEGQRKYNEVLATVTANRQDHEDAIHILDDEDDAATIRSSLGL
jgi:hypothetical protein